LQMDVVPGDLTSHEALRALVDGADVIIHAAGLIKARSSADFEAVNVGDREPRTGD
jgi:nucleoside-diphosphate-sugar epimerase